MVLNNAGYSLVGTAEEASVERVRAMFDANYFGTLRVIQAALPLLRQQGGGHIVGVSSTLGHVAMPLIGFYCASKWAFEALHESLAQEVKPFGIKVTLIEPGAYATEFGSPASLKIAPGMDAYAGLRQQVIGRLKARNAAIRRRPRKPFSRSWTRRTHRCGSSSAAPACPWCAPLTQTASPPGRRGRPSRTPPRASHDNASSHHSNGRPASRVLTDGGGRRRAISDRTRSASSGVAGV